MNSFEIRSRRIASQGLGIAAVVAAALLLAGCASTPGSTPKIDSTTVVGTWGDADDPTAPSLTFTDKGEVSGTTGCNRVTGTWELDDDRVIEFDRLAITQMACEGIDEWLAGAEEATISGSTMTILGDDDKVLGTLER